MDKKRLPHVIHGVQEIKASISFYHIFQFGSDHHKSNFFKNTFSLSQTGIAVRNDAKPFGAKA